MKTKLEHLNDVWNIVALPLICLFSLTTNTLNIVVLSRLQVRNSIYKHMLWNCVAYLIYSFICFFIFTIKCADYCDIKDTYAVRLYEVYLYYYLATVVGLFSTMIEVWIAMERLLLIKNISVEFLRKRSGLVLLAFAVVSSLVYLPLLVCNEIRSRWTHDALTNTSKLVYYKYLNAETELGRIYIGTQMSMRGWLVAVLFFILNILIFVSIRKRVDKKIKMKRIIVNQNHNSNSQPQAASKSNKPKQQKLSAVVTNGAARQLSTTTTAAITNGESAELSATTTTTSTSAKQQQQTGVRHSEVGECQATKAKKKKMSVKTKERSEMRNVTHFVIVMCVLYFAGNFLHSFAFFVRFVFKINEPLFTTFFILTSNTLLFASQSCSLFVYYKFNSNFRAEFDQLFCSSSSSAGRETSRDAVMMKVPSPPASSASPPTLPIPSS